MYIVAIAWIYVTLLMALTETSFVAGVATFLFYGLFPLSILLWLMGTPERRRRRQRAASAEAGAKAGGGEASEQSPGATTPAAPPAEPPRPVR
ncbi:hypothetical protein M6I34_01210 [Burkholderiaceae bacterium FT117]|uniref:hypothetical protein n=1 Tax=Zeimonas sediminis TaxID=2944268 RepID=UPI002343236B|nr:hypothetical protein [Zeimonas sediminis]MCM5569119.1 hypothetical protein [Zeimonas sediminis]